MYFSYFTKHGTKNYEEKLTTSLLNNEADMYKL